MPTTRKSRSEEGLRRRTGHRGVGSGIDEEGNVRGQGRVGRDAQDCSFECGGGRVHGLTSKCDSAVVEAGVEREAPDLRNGVDAAAQEEKGQFGRREGGKN